jgi:hypothetical protein
MLTLDSLQIASPDGVLKKLLFALCKIMLYDVSKKAGDLIMLCPYCKENIPDAQRNGSDKGSAVILMILIPLLIGALCGYFVLPLIITPQQPIVEANKTFNGLPTVLPELKETELEPETEKEDPTEEVEVIKLKGNGTKTSDTFRITGDKWKIYYKAGDINTAGIFQIYVYDSDGNLISVAANTKAETEDQTYIHESGEYYLEINSANTDWALIVTEYV